MDEIFRGTGIEWRYRGRRAVPVALSRSQTLVAAALKSEASNTLNPSGESKVLDNFILTIFPYSYFCTNYLSFLEHTLHLLDVGILAGVGQVLPTRTVRCLRPHPLARRA